MADPTFTYESNIIDPEPDFIEKYKWSILGGVVALVIAVAGFAIWKVQSATAAADAAASFSSANTLTERQAVLEKYKGASTLALPLLSVAEEQYTAKDLDSSVKSYEEFIRLYPGHALIGAARLGLASSLEAKDNKKGALDAYISASDRAADDPYKALSLLAQARLYADEKNWQAARKALETVKSIYGESPFAMEANTRLAKLPKS